MNARLNVSERRSVKCPKCLAAPGKPCQSSRIGSPAKMGGGWGGYSELSREHSERVTAVRAVSL